MPFSTEKLLEVAATWVRQGFSVKINAPMEEHIKTLRQLGFTENEIFRLIRKTIYADATKQIREAMKKGKPPSQ